MNCLNLMTGWVFFAPMVNRCVSHTGKEHSTSYNVNRNSWRIFCNWYLSQGLSLWFSDFILLLPFEFRLIGSALINLMKFCNFPMVMRNREIAIPECKTLQKPNLPLLSLHCHFNDAKLLKWVQSLTSPKAIRVSHLVVLFNSHCYQWMFREPSDHSGLKACYDLDVSVTLRGDIWRIWNLISTSDQKL